MTHVDNINNNIKNNLSDDVIFDIDLDDIVTAENTSGQNMTTFERLHEQYSRATSLILIAIVLSSFIALLLYTIILDINDIDRTFWINQVVKYISITLVQCSASAAVVYYDVKVNYTRKVLHIFYFVWPQLLDTEIIHFPKTILTELWNIAIVFLALIVMLDPIRKQSRFFEFLFKAVDRPEDRPYTNFWFVSQLAACIAIIATMSVFFQYVSKENLVFIPLIVLVLGDGLAEPIGVRFGKHKYTVKGLFIETRYTRSVEGSMCVWISAIIAVVVYYRDLQKASIVFALCLLPPASTFIEARSPHTWDNPSILVVGYIIIVAAYYLGTA